MTAWLAFQTTLTCLLNKPRSSGSSVTNYDNKTQFKRRTSHEPVKLNANEIKL